MNFDLVNAVFQVGGAFASAHNVVEIYRVKQVKGVSMISTFWFSLWSCWNVVYFKTLGQTLSWVCAGTIAAINLIWLGQVYYYKRNKEVYNGKNGNDGIQWLGSWKP